MGLKVMTDNTNWQDPLNQILFKNAFKAQATEVTLRDGRKFSIEYETRKGELMAYVKIIKQQYADSSVAPAGWFNVKNYTK